MLALFRPLCWCFMPWTYSGLYTEALYYGFILGFILGFMSLGRGVSVASGAVLAPLTEGWVVKTVVMQAAWAVCSAGRVPLTPGDKLTGGPSTPGELNPLAPGDSTVVFAFVLSYSKLYSSLFLSIQGFLLRSPQTSS